MAPKGALYIQVSVDYLDHPKVVQSGSDGAVLNLGAIMYARKFMTDGFVPDSAVAGLAPTVKKHKASVAACVAAGLWTKVEGGYRVHDYDVWNPTKAAIIEKREGWKAEKQQQRACDVSATDKQPDKVTDTQPDNPTDSQTRAADAHSDSPSSSAGVGSEGGVGETAKPWRQSLVPGGHRSHGWCTDRGLCLPQSLYDELLGRLGGVEHTPTLLKWLGQTVSGLAGKPIGDSDIWRFWRARFEQWQGTTTPQNTKGARTVAAGNRLQTALDDGAEIDPFGTKAHARQLAEKATA